MHSEQFEVQCFAKGHLYMWTWAKAQTTNLITDPLYHLSYSHLLIV